MGHMSQIPMAAFDPSFWLLHWLVDKQSSSESNVCSSS